jgi:hypothetical protein
MIASLPALAPRLSGPGEKLLNASASVSREVFSRSSLTRMVKLAECFPEEQIVASLMQQLSWTHFLQLLPLADPLKRDFYAEMCRLERWSVRTLRKKIDWMLFERTALSKKPDHLIRRELDSLREEDKLTPDLVFRDSYASAVRNHVLFRLEDAPHSS